MRRLDAARRNPQEVIGAEVVDLVEEDVESVALLVRTLLNGKSFGDTHEFSFSSNSNMRL